MTNHLIRFPRRRLGHVRLARNPHGKGWMFTLDLGPGAGYRWMDFGPYSQNVNARWFESLSVSGRTLRLGRNVKRDGKRRAWGGHWFTRNANVRLYPGWW